LIFLYDRAGYGKSDHTDLERSPKIIAQQLKELISQIIPNKQYLLIGHSIGGLYAQQFIRDYKDNIVGSIFLDPVTTCDYRFKIGLTRREYRRSGIDKSAMIKQGVLFGNLRLLKLFKPLLKRSIPFYYYKNYDKTSEQEILNHLTQLKTYRAMIREYKTYEDQNIYLSQLIENAFPQIPIRVLYHNPEIMINEIVKFGGLSKNEATKIDVLWKEIIDNHYSKLSNDYKLEIAEHSGHYIHLTDKEILYSTIDEIFGVHNVVEN
jgi:hypothetical protein